MWTTKSSVLKLYTRGVDQVCRMKKYRRYQKLSFYIHQLVTSVATWIHEEKIIYYYNNNAYEEKYDMAI